MSFFFVPWLLLGAGFVVWIWRAIRSPWVGAIALVICALSISLITVVGLALNPEIGGLAQQMAAAAERHKIWLSLGVGIGGVISSAFHVATLFRSGDKANKALKQTASVSSQI